MATTYDLNAIRNYSQAQLAQLFWSLPAEGSRTGWDGGPDTAWMTNNWTDAASGAAVEQRFIPTSPPVHVLHIAASAYQGEKYELDPILTGGWNGQFVQMFGPAVVMVGGAVLAAGAAGAGSGAASTITSTGGSTVGDFGINVSDFSASDVAASSGDLTSFGDYGTTLSDVGSSTVDFGTTAADYGTTAADYGTSAGDIYGGAANIALPDAPLASIPDITVSTDLTSSLPSFNFNEFTQITKSVLGTITAYQQAMHPAPRSAVTTRIGSQVVTPNRNGTITMQSGGQSRTVPMQPGTPYTFSDGSVVVNNGDGTYTTILPDGSHTVTRYPSTGGLSSMFGGASGTTNPNLPLYLGGALLLVLLLRR